MNEDVFYGIECLFDEFWILREENPELYRLISRNRKDIRKILNERFGLQLIYHPRFYQVQKRPINPMAWMGISDFSDPLDYALLMCAMAYTEDKSEKEAFLLSELVEEVQHHYPRENFVDWTNYRHRRSLVRVLKKMLALHLIEVIEGETEEFLNDEASRGDVLYQVTVYSRYFLGHRPDSYSDFNSFEEMKKSFKRLYPIERPQRVYQRLLLEPVLLRTEETISEFEYLRNQYTSLEKFWEQTSFRFELTKDTAILSSNQRRRGNFFPAYRVVDEILLQLAADFRQEMPACDAFGRMALSYEEWQRRIDTLKERNDHYWSKEYREMQESDIAKILLRTAQQQYFLEYDSSTITIFPSFARMIGQLNTEGEQTSE
ncbi:TIGR02678 family protein [Enterococcus gilvus]|uniref:TIGR02678 family protein n=1 Tax=Enterococcus gilvus TaxID=160453 RepID=UPI003EDA00CD